MNNMWNLVKRLYRCFVKKEKAIISTYPVKQVSVNYIRVKKGDRRYVLSFTDTNKQVPEWVRKKNLGRLTKKEMLCIN